MNAKQSLDKFVRNLSWYAVIPLIIVDLAATPADAIVGIAIPFAGTIGTSALAGVIGFFVALAGQIVDNGYQPDDVGMAMVAGFLVAIPLPILTIALGGVKLFKGK